jgi:rubrerythrin
MKTIFECQICGNIVEGCPDEWCAKCGGHRIIFKRITLQDHEFSLAS